MSGRLVVHVIPRAHQTRVVGRRGDAIGIRVTAPPADGAANQELCRFVAARLGVPPSAVRIARGAASRRKVLEVVGVTSDAAEQRLLGPGRAG